jgi:uncharacterized protein
VVSRQLLISLAAGLLFGAGLALSGMTDPGRVRAFLDVAGAWDSTLAFVMGGALAPMALAWRVQRRLERPIGAGTFDLPQRSAIDAQLVGGAALFGVGWGASGLCPGPAIANLALQPTHAGLFVMAMLGGMALHRMASVSAVLRTA